VKNEHQMKYLFCLPSLSFYDFFLFFIKNVRKDMAQAEKSSNTFVENSERTDDPTILIVRKL